MLSFIKKYRWAPVVLVITLTACTVHPPGEKEERAAALRSGRAFEKPSEERRIPSLPDNPTTDQIVDYALLNSGELEQRYWQWRAAIEQIPQDGTQTTSLNIAAGTAITNGHSSWSSSTVALSNDPMTDIKWPGKLDAAAKQTLENAKAAGQRFVKAKYELRGKVLHAYYEYALNAELIRLEQANQNLLQTAAITIQARNRAGTSSQQDALKASNQIDISRNEISTMESALVRQRAAINALLNRPTDSPLPVPSKLPPTRFLAFTDSQLVELAAKKNPELHALADEINARHQGIRLAKLQYVPDLNLSAGTDLIGVTQSILGQMTIPIFRYQALNAAIAQAEANLHASEAMNRQANYDLSANVIADIVTIRDADRQLDLFDHAILPRAHQIVNISRSAYETAQASLLDWLNDQQSLIAIQRLDAHLRIVREIHLVNLESITTLDLSHLRR